MQKLHLHGTEFELKFEIKVINDVKNYYLSVDVADNPVLPVPC
jgi:hypothetical protein